MFVDYNYKIARLFRLQQFFRFSLIFCCTLIKSGAFIKKTRITELFLTTAFEKYQRS